MACGIGAVLIERYIVDELIGGHVSHCYGHVFSDPTTRLAFQRALARTTETPGSMVYGNTTIFVESEIENYANLASYLLVDLVAQRTQPTGHGLNPEPVTEALRIPEIDEIVNAHLFANRLATRSVGFTPMFDLEAAEQIAERLVEGGQRFKTRVLDGLAESGIDTANPFELLLSIRRIGAKRLEKLWGPGKEIDGVLRKRDPVVMATTIASLESQAAGIVTAMSETERNAISTAKFVGCVTCTDVHEYGKLLVEAVLDRVGVRLVDAGVSTDPDLVARRAKTDSVHFIAVSTYSGVALAYLWSLRNELDRQGIDVPVFIGGKLNQVPESSSSSMPVDVTDELIAVGAVVCHRMEDMLTELSKMAEGETA
jgi:methylmalonyl-CoA mutase cobalamin-binding subunit